MTEQRRLITEIIRDTPNHMTAEQIYTAAKSRMPSIAMGTVYRNLGLMEQSGEIRRIPVSGAPDRYDRNVKLHEHMLCRRCGNLEDVWMENLLELINDLTEVRIDSYELALYGICSECQKAAAAAAETTNAAK